MYKTGVKVDENTSSTAHKFALEGLYYGAIGNGIWAVNPAFVFGDMSVNGTAVGNAEQAASGMGDPAIAFAYWPLVNRKEKNFIGMSLTTTVPLGQYSNAKSVNIGSNIWTFKTEAGWIKGWGPFYLQLSGNATFYTDNKEYTTNNLTRQRDPLYTGEAWLSYDLTPTLYVGGLYSYVNGGESKIKDGASRNDKTASHIFGAYIRYKVTPNLSVGLRFKDMVETENGALLHEMVKVKITYAW